MHELAVLISILGVFLLGTISPGPSFVVVSRIAILRSRTDGVMAAIGMGIGGFVFAAVAVAGLTAILLQVEWLNIALRLAGGAYLLWLGINIWRAAPEPLEIPDTASERQSTLWTSLLRALLVQLSNPKTAIFYASMAIVERGALGRALQCGSQRYGAVTRCPDDLPSGPTLDQVAPPPPHDLMIVRDENALTMSALLAFCVSIRRVHDDPIMALSCNSGVGRSGHSA